MNIKQTICALLLLGCAATSTVVAANLAPKKGKPAVESKEAKESTPKAEETWEDNEESLSTVLCRRISPIISRQKSDISTTPTAQRVGNTQVKTLLTHGLSQCATCQVNNQNTSDDMNEKKEHANCDVSANSIHYLQQFCACLFNQDFSDLKLATINNLEEYPFLCRNLLNDAFVHAIENNIFNEKRPTTKKEAGITRAFATTYIMVTDAPQAWLKNMLSAAYDIPAKQWPLAKKILAYFCSQLCKKARYTPSARELSTWMGEALGDQKSYRTNLIEVFEACNLAPLIRSSNEPTVDNFIAIIEDIIAAVVRKQFDSTLTQLYERLHIARPPLSTSNLRKAVIQCLQKICTDNPDGITWIKRKNTKNPFASPCLCRRGLEELYITLSPILDNKSESKSAYCASNSTRKALENPSAFFCDSHSLRVILSKSPLTTGTINFNGGHFLTGDVVLNDSEIKYPKVIKLPEETPLDVARTILHNFDPTKHDPDGKLQKQWVVSAVQIDARDPKTGIIKAVWQISDATDTKAPVKTKDSTLFPQCYNRYAYEYINLILRATQDDNFAAKKGIKFIDKPYQQQQQGSLTLYGCKIQHAHSFCCCKPQCSCDKTTPITVQLYYFIDHKTVPVLILESMYPIFPEKSPTVTQHGSGSISAASTGTAGSTQTGATRSGQRSSPQRENSEKKSNRAKNNTKENEHKD